MEPDGCVRERIDLALPLLVIRARRGFLACAYIDLATCERTGEACARVSGVRTHEEMLDAAVQAVTPAAAALGVRPGMSGREALALLS